MHITLLGTGLMGTSLARRLAGCGYNVQVWNRTIRHAEILEGDGIAFFAEASSAIKGAEAVVLTLSDAEAIDAVLSQPGVLDALTGCVLVQMGTISPQQSRALESRLASAGVAYLEAPVLGSRQEAAEGTLLVMAGGETAVYTRCLPWLSHCGHEPMLIGPVGQAATLKLALNQLIASLTAGFAFSLGLVRREGVPVEAFMGVLRQSALYAPTFDKKLNRMLMGDYSMPNFPLKHLLKDVVLCHDLGVASDLDAGVLDALVQVLESGVSGGHADEDYASLAAVICP